MPPDVLMYGRDEKVSQFRLTAVQYIILVVFLILAYGLWRLQVVQSDFYANLAEKNRIRSVPILAPRGRILDREGRTIVDNYPSFTALLLRDSTRDIAADANLIATGLHLDPKEVQKSLRNEDGETAIVTTSDGELLGLIRTAQIKTQKPGRAA